MSEREIGFVVVEFNQASGQPRTASDIYDNRADAEDVTEQHREETRKIGRRERFAVGTVTIEEED